MRIGVFVFFNFKSPVFLFQFYADINIYIYIVWIVFIIFYIAVAEFILHHQQIFPVCQPGSSMPSLFFLPDFKVICTKCRCRMNNTCSIFGGYKISGHNSGKDQHRESVPESLSELALQRESIVHNGSSPMLEPRNEDNIFQGRTLDASLIGCKHLHFHPPV